MTAAIDRLREQLAREGPTNLVLVVRTADLREVLDAIAAEREACAEIEQAIRARSKDRCTMRTHELKTVQPHFSHVQSGAKRAEIRRDDRGFAVGDVLVLREYEPSADTFTGRFIEVRITHVLRGFEGLAEGWVSLSVEPLQPSLFDGCGGMP